MNQISSGEKNESVLDREPKSSRRERLNSEALHKPHKQFEIDIFKGWCKSCGICAAFCPRDCISLDENGSPVVENGSRCTGCGWCELHCPDFAISVHPAKDAKPDGEEY